MSKTMIKVIECLVRCFPEFANVYDLMAYTGRLNTSINREIFEIRKILPIRSEIIPGSHCKCHRIATAEAREKAAIMINERNGE